MRNLRLETALVAAPAGAPDCAGAAAVRVTLTDGSHQGRGEARPDAAAGETAIALQQTLDALSAEVAGGLTREALQSRLPAGAARAALDCAFWDLDAKTAGKPVWQLAGLPAPASVGMAATIALADPARMAEAAKTAPGSLLKLDLGGPDDLAALKAVHQARPEARFILDGQESLSAEAFAALSKSAGKFGTVLIFQPFAPGKDSALMKRPGPVAVCAGRGARTSGDIQALARSYDAVCVSVERAGGLTEAIAMAHAARRAGLGVMVKSSAISALAAAPAILLAGLAEAICFDGPIPDAENCPDGLPPWG